MMVLILWFYLGILAFCRSYMFSIYADPAFYDGVQVSPLIGSKDSVHFFYKPRRHFMTLHW